MPNINENNFENSQRQENVNEKQTLITPLPMHEDPPESLSNLKFGDLQHSLLVNQNVLESINKYAPLRKRLGIILQQLGAHGRTSVVKGSSDNKNKGWLRSPLGGNNGMQFYLWWTHQGNQPVKKNNTDLLSPREILVRAVRQHDNHSPLNAGKKEDCYPINPRDLEDDNFIGRPWTENQLHFIEAKSPIRFVLGSPGSGKTTVLWKAIETRSNQRVLYLTWSRNLTEYSDERFQSFAPSDVKVVSRDFPSFLGEICHDDIKRFNLHKSQEAFKAIVSRLHPNILGPWKERQNALLAEIRAFLIGRAIPGDKDAVVENGLTWLTNEKYLQQRGNKFGVGSTAAKALLGAINHFKNNPQLVKLLPELTAAVKAITLLRNNKIPDEFLNFDRIVVDEVQDLTLLESTAIVELLRAIARKRKYAPWLLLAGDDGQTVRPSGFDLGTLKDLIGRKIGRLEKFKLEENLRCPSRINEVIERASILYNKVKREFRPKKQQRSENNQNINANLLYVNVKTKKKAVELLEQLDSDSMKGIVVLTPHDEIPSWVPLHLQDSILTPAEAKGLEYQSVVLLDPGKLLASFDPNPEKVLTSFDLDANNILPTSEPDLFDIDAFQLKEHMLRTAIDQLRVALSRTTETLAFVDVKASDIERKFSLKLLDSPVPYEPDDLVEHFTDKDITPEERVLMRIKDARALIDEKPTRAWRRALQAVRLLGDPELPNGVAAENVRMDAYKTLIATAARFLVDGIPDGISYNDVVFEAKKVFNTLNDEKGNLAFEQLKLWTKKRSSEPFALLYATLFLCNEGKWLRSALVSVAQELRQKIDEYSTFATSAKKFDGNVKGWLKLTMFSGNMKNEVTRLRSQAVDALIKSKDLVSAEKILKLLSPPNLIYKARLREAQGRYEEAAKIFEKAADTFEKEKTLKKAEKVVKKEKALKEAIHNWRLAGKWEEAYQLIKRVKVATKKEISDLHWLIQVNKLIEEAPVGLTKRLTVAEKGRLSNLLRNVDK